MFLSPKYSNFLHLDEPIVIIILYFKARVSALSVYGFIRLLRKLVYRFMFSG